MTKTDRPYANLSEHKLEMQIKALFHVGDNSEGPVQTGNTTGPLAQESI